MNDKKNELKIEVSPEVAGGHFSNLALINHSPTEFFLDFIAMAPGIPQARVQSRIIMTPEHAKNLLAALSDNIRKYEATFGEIKQKFPKNVNGMNGNPGEIPNPFISGGMA
ncbi:MAG: DUF3467 domain-containing protein [Paramuribaculum sp.]|nr:DUF3467 domain-containing protein [Paramuribaculum sp.]